MNYDYKSSTENETFSKGLIRTNLKLRSWISSYFNDPLCLSFWLPGKTMERQTLVVPRIICTQGHTTVRGAVLDVCMVSLAFNQIWRRHEKSERNHSLFGSTDARSVCIMNHNDNRSARSTRPASYANLIMIKRPLLFRQVQFSLLNEYSVKHQSFVIKDPHGLQY